LSVIVVDTEVEAVEERHWILLDVVGVTYDDIDNLKIKSILLLRLVLGESVRFFKSICHLVMEINFLSELLQIVSLDLLIDFSSDLVFSP
jgi:hypothetical protein